MSAWVSHGAQGGERVAENPLSDSVWWPIHRWLVAAYLIVLVVVAWRRARAPGLKRAISSTQSSAEPPNR